MKTPREILLKRHRAIEVRLDAIRQRVMSQELHSADAWNKPSTVSIARAFVRLPARIWHELFWKSRRIWIGLSATWLVIIAVNVIGLDEPSFRRNTGRAAAPDILAFLAERQRLMAQLEDVTPPPPPQPAGAPGPRSEYRVANRARC